MVDSAFFDTIKKKRAFTLIELLVVVMIIGILAAIVIINVYKAQDKAHYARLVGDMSLIAKEVNIYKASHNGNKPKEWNGRSNAPDRTHVFYNGVNPSNTTTYNDFLAENMSGVLPVPVCENSDFAYYDYTNYSVVHYWSPTSTGGASASYQVDGDMTGSQWEARDITKKPDKEITCNDPDASFVH